MSCQPCCTPLLTANNHLPTYLCTLLPHTAAGTCPATNWWAWPPHCSCCLKKRRLQPLHLSPPAGACQPLVQHAAPLWQLGMLCSAPPCDEAVTHMPARTHPLIILFCIMPHTHVCARGQLASGVSKQDCENVRINHQNETGCPDRARSQSETRELNGEDSTCMGLVKRRYSTAGGLLQPLFNQLVEETRG